MTTETPQAILAPVDAFASTIYTVKKPEFLGGVTALADKALAVTKAAIPINETYPSVMSGSMIGDPAGKDFETFIAQSAWMILDSQGYMMDNLLAYSSELWAQEHFKYSGMEQHVHPHGVVISGFYFLTAPEDGSYVVFHDPRAGKVQASLPLKHQDIVSAGANMFTIKPEPGLFVFSNSWLPHSFTRNASQEPVKFIHFNVSVRPVETPTTVVL